MGLPFGYERSYRHGSNTEKVVTLVCMYSGVDLALCYRRIGQFMGIPDKAPLPVYQNFVDEDRHHGTRKFYKQHQVHGFEVSMVEAAH